MKKFLYRFLVVTLAFGLLVPTWLATGGFSAIKAEAAVLSTVGPNTGTVINDHSNSGDAGWFFASRAAVSNDQYATTIIDHNNDKTDYLKATGFGFSIPVGSTISGVEAKVEKYQNCAEFSCTSSVTDETVKLVKNGSVVGTNHASTLAWSSSDSITTYGTSSDLWGTSLTRSDVINGNFGFVISATRNQGGDRMVFVDSMTLTVYYNTPDTEKPVIEHHSDVVAEAASTAGANVTYSAPNATDNVDATAPATCLPASGSLFPIGDTTVTCTKTDVAGNSATPTTFKVTVQDTTKPVINSVTSAPDTTGEYSTITINASDLVGIVSAEISINSAPYVPLIGTEPNYVYYYTLPTDSLTVVNYSLKFKDAAGNELISARTINPADNDAPSVPTASIIAGNYTSAQTVTLSATDNITTSPAIYYTLNGTDPSDSNGYVYTGAITINQTETLKAIAYDEAGNKSAVANFAYKITIASDIDDTNSAVTTASSSTTTVIAGPAVSQQVTSTDTGSTITDDSTTDTSDGEQGQIKGEETTNNDAEENINWTPWIILFILILLAGAATGGYFYWFGKDEEEEIVSKTVIKNTKKTEVKATPKKKPQAKKNSKRW